MEHEHPELSAYLDEELTPAQRRQVEHRLAAEPDYAQELRALERTRTMILAAIERPTFHARLMAQVQQESRPRRLRLWPLAAAALLLVVAGLGYHTVSGRMAAPPPAPEGHAAAPAPSEAFQEVREAPLEHIALAEATTTEPPDAQAAAALPRIEALGTLTGAVPQATLRVDGGRSRTYELGEEVAPDIFLESVMAGSVTLGLESGESLTIAVGEKPETGMPKTLTGLWQFYDLREDGKTKPSGAARLLHEEDSLQLVRLTEQGERMSTLTGSVSIQGQRIAIAMAAGTTELRGTISKDWNELRLEVVPPEGQQVSSRLLLTRMPEEESQQRMALQEAMHQCEQELKQIAAALKSYRELQGTHPPALSALVPQHLADAALLETSEERQLQYFPNANMPPSPAVLQNSLPKEPAAAPRDTYPDRLMAHEQALRALGMERLLWPELLVKLSYPEQQVEALLYTDQRVQSRQSGQSSGASRVDPAVLAAMRASCQNNLKQLGLIIKMYENEHHNYTPPGWLSVYPEYLVDVTVLTSPKDEPGTVSYEYLLPATHTEGLFEEALAGGDPKWAWLHDEFDENGELSLTSKARFQSQVPVAINKTDWPDGGRNMLFLDGHVEYTKEWRQKLQMLP